MLAIAGAKGGCGKTTMTLGLATALAGHGTPILAVDADRQLPSLHTVAEVDREPTIAALDGETDVASIAKPVSGVPGVGVLTAQRPSERVDLSSTLTRIDYDTAEVLIDCPSGVGPDFVEALSIADSVVVVTTDTERSLEAAQTTIDTAERLGVPVAGIVFNRCEAVSAELAAAFDAEILGAVPDSESPLSDQNTNAALEAVANTLSITTGVAREGDGVPKRPDRLRTGIDGLDRLLDGGVPPGGMVALEATPASQAELLLYNLTATRGTLYLTSERSVDAVRDAMEISPVEVGRSTIRELDSDAPLGTATSLIENLPDGANLIIDAVDPLELSDRADYVAFLNDVRDRTATAAGLTVLHCLDPAPESGHRELTEQFADAVVEFCPDQDGGRPGLALEKFRAEQCPDRYELVSLSEAVPITPPE